MKLKAKNMNNIKITRMQIVKKKPELKPNTRDKVEKKELIKNCKDCQMDKPLDEFVINYTYKCRNDEEKKSIKFKNKCLECYKEISKKYYADNKERVLNM